MSRLSSLPARELEQLSAYADGQLPLAEADRLRARLEQDAGLRQALRELRQTADLLRGMPALAAPRSFALPAERVVARRRYPRLQLATALASLAFILVVGVDVLAGSAMRAATLTPITEQVAAPASDRGAEPAEEPVEESAAAEQLQLAPMEAAGTPEAEAARAAELPPAEDLLTAPTPTAGEGQLASVPAAEEGAQATLEATQLAGASYANAVETSPPSGTPAPTGTSSPSAAEPRQELEEAEPAVANGKEMVAAQPEVAQIPEAPIQDGLRPESRLPAQRGGVNLPRAAVWLLEGGLALTTLVLGLLTVRSRRRR